MNSDVKKFEELMEDMENKYSDGNRGMKSYFPHGFFSDLFALGGDVCSAYASLGSPGLFVGVPFYYTASEVIRKDGDIDVEDCYYKRFMLHHRAISKLTDKIFPKRKPKVNEKIYEDYSTFVDNWEGLSDELDAEQSKRAEEIFDEMTGRIKYQRI